MGPMKIGQVAEQTGVSVDTIRFYERRGVLPKPERRASGYRVYTEATFERIRLVKALQALGFTLDEVIDALHTIEQGGIDSCNSQRWRLEAVLERLDRKIEEVQRVRKGVVEVLNECHAGQCALRQGEIATRTLSVKAKLAESGASSADL